MGIRIVQSDRELTHLLVEIHEYKFKVIFKAIFYYYWLYNQPY